MEGTQRMNLNTKQVLAIILAVLSVLSGSTAQLTDLIGAQGAKAVISIASLAMSVMSSVLAVLSSQNNIVKDVAAMPGVQRIDVNENANSTLAAIAVDPMQPKVGAVNPVVRETLKDIVKG
jgi:hypothetical protein